MLRLTRDEHLFTLTMCNGENRFTNAWLGDVHAKLDEVQAAAAEGPAGLIVVGEGKFWSNGIDLDALGAASPTDREAFVPALNRLLGRLVTLPVPTVAALNGHAFAGGALLAMAFDYRVMRSGRGWICLPEVDIEIPFHPAMLGLLAHKLVPTTLRDAVLSGRRYTGDEAVAAGIVDATFEPDALVAGAAAALAPVVEKKRGIFGSMKAGLYGEVAQAFGYVPA